MLCRCMFNKRRWNGLNYVRKDSMQVGTHWNESEARFCKEFKRWFFVLLFSLLHWQDENSLSGEVQNETKQTVVIVDSSSAGQNSCNEMSLTRRSFSGTQRPGRQNRWVGMVRVAMLLSQAASSHVSSFERFSPKDWSMPFAVAEAFLLRYTELIDQLLQSFWNYRLIIALDWLCQLQNLPTALSMDNSVFLCVCVLLHYPYTSSWYYSAYFISTGYSKWK